MADPVSLSRFRKARARAGKKTKADENAVHFGRSKARKALERARTDKSARDLDAHRRDRT